jgi:hypothetical protein
LRPNSIPSFPELISIQSVRDEVAHGTSDFQKIDAKYYSTAEKEYAEELATVRVLELIRNGLIRSTGRKSETKRGTARRWEAQRYKHHSKLRTYIDTNFWQKAVFGGYGFHEARTEGIEYTDILVVLEDCIEHLGDEVRARQTSSDPKDEAAKSEVSYSTPYIELMWEAIDQFQISNKNQPIKENLVEWFLSKQIEGQKISRATAEYLASFVRLPTSRLGGNRPWRVREEQSRHL